MKTPHVNGIEIKVAAKASRCRSHGSNLAAGLAPMAAALAAAAPSSQPVRSPIFAHWSGMAGSGGRGWPISVQQQGSDGLSLLDAVGLPSRTCWATPTVP